MIYKDFEIREINISEGESMVNVEHTCFPEGVAETRENLLFRISRAPELFLVAVKTSGNDKGRLVAYLNGIATNDEHFDDKYFNDLCLYDNGGNNIFLLGLAVLPQYQGMGIATALMKEYIRKQKSLHRHMLLLTCLENKISMYEKLGYMDKGIANSNWGGESWHEMQYVL